MDAVAELLQLENDIGREALIDEEVEQSWAGRRRGVRGRSDGKTQEFVDLGRELVADQCAKR